MTRGINRLGFLALALAAGSVAAYSQSTTTGAIYGVITDEKGNPVAGATVRLTSPQITRTETTGPNGSFRFGLLNPGQWRLNVTKAGFQNANRDVTIQTNTNHQANMKLATVASTTVEVVASQMAAVDLTSTQTGANYQMDTIQTLPMGRDMNSIVNFTPGVTDSGFGMGASISGASAAENTYVLDGLNTTDSRYGGIGNSLVTDFIDQVEVQTGGFKPEFSALGGVFNAVTKSGTNDFKGSSWLTFDARGMQASPKSTFLYRQGEAQRRFDVGAEVSGPIIKDKLFYFVGVQGDLRENNGATNAYGMQDSKQKSNFYQTVAKLNWFISQDLQLTFSGNYNPYTDKQDTRYPLYGNAEWGYENTGFTMGLNVALDWTISPAMMLSAKLGRFQIRDEQDPNNSTDPLITDRRYYHPTAGTEPRPDLYAALVGYARGGFGTYVPLEEGITDQFRVDLSYFLGNHNFKFGVSFLKSEYTENTQQSGGNGNWLINGSASWVRQTLYTQDATVESNYTAVYLQDTWEMMPGLKLSYGARLESQEQKGSDGSTFLKFGMDDAFQPRVGLIYDPANDGKTKYSVNYARYYEQMPQRMAMRQRGNEVYLLNYYSIPAGGYTTTGIPTHAATPFLVYDYATPFTAIPIMDGIKLPQRDEVIVGIDHTLSNGWLLGVHAKHRKMKNPIEDFSPWIYNTTDGGWYVDGGYDDWGQAILGNPKAGTITWTTKDFSVSNTTPGVPQKMSWDSTYPNPKNIYQSVDFTADKKTERYYLSFSYTWSRLEGNYEGLVSASNGQADANITASWDYPIYVGYGLLPIDRTHSVKFAGSYNWDLGPGRLTAGWFYTYRSGVPISQFTSVEDVTGVQTTGIGLGNWTLPGSQIPVVDYGHYGDQMLADFRYGQFGRTPALQNTDFRLEYALKAGGFHIVPSIDIFNVFNSRKATSVVNEFTDRNGDPWGRWKMENGWQTGRRFRFGVKVRF